MKWFSMIVVLIVGGFLVYELFLAAPPAGTPYATANAFVKAAIAGDAAQVKSLCVPSAAEGAVATAESVRRDASNLLATQLGHVDFQRMEPMSRDAQYAVMVTLSGRMLGIEMKREGAGWKIVLVSFAQ